ncbi:MAG: dTMP kinase, partial [Thermomicrobiaceae bacterium]|nr:dTMP kinase [Thermomicrobiaceae bacterium]
MSLFVTFEGPEGGGKSTQARLLARALEERGYAVVTTREPGGTPVGEAIRAILLGPEHSAMLAKTEALLNTAARAQHVAQVIRPALEAGRVVICDRFADSTLAYQGAGRGLDEAALRELQRFAIGDLVPDLTLLLDVPVAVGLARRVASGEPLSRFDVDERAFHERVRDWFLGAAAREPSRWRVIDAERAPEEVARDVLQA